MGDNSFTQLLEKKKQEIEKNSATSRRRLGRWRMGTRVRLDEDILEAWAVAGGVAKSVCSRNALKTFPAISCSTARSAA